MPSGKSHTIATTTLSLSLTLVSLCYGTIETAIMGAGALTGLIIDPDLDQDGWTISEARVGKIWFLLWYPYGKLFKHRGISHWPIIGTLTRAWFILPLAFWIDLQIVLLFFGGLCLADILHIIMDWSTTWFNRKF